MRSFGSVVGRYDPRGAAGSSENRGRARDDGRRAHRFVRDRSTGCGPERCRPTSHVDDDRRGGCARRHRVRGSVPVPARRRRRRVPGAVAQRHRSRARPPRAAPRVGRDDDTVRRAAAPPRAGRACSTSRCRSPRRPARARAVPPRCRMCSAPGSSSCSPTARSPRSRSSTSTACSRACSCTTANASTSTHTSPSGGRDCTRWPSRDDPTRMEPSACPDERPRGGQGPRSHGTITFTVLPLGPTAGLPS